jgi:hypothetical protein
MRGPGVKLGLALAVLALAACGDGGGNGGATEPAPTSASPSGPAATGVAECVTGDWRTTGVEAGTGDQTGTVSVSGGGGVSLTIGADGATAVDFAGMAPVSFDGEVAGASVAGELSYGGSASGTVRTDTGATSGMWEPVGTADWSGVTVTVDLTEPVAGRPIDNAPIGEVVEQADEVTGEVVDVEPVLGEGTFQCEGDTLVLGPAEGDPGLAWTLERA